MSLVPRGLRHDIGETIEDMDEVFTVVPVSKYAEMTRLTTQVERLSSGPFKRVITVTLPIFTAAIEYAAEAFENVGIPRNAGVDVDCICQEYPRTEMVAFIFHARQGVSDFFAVAPFRLGSDQIADLTGRGLWTPYRAN